MVMLVVLLGLATSTLITLGYQKTQRDATERSIQGLAGQGRATLLQLVSLEAQTLNSELHQAGRLTRIAADYLIAMKHRDGTIPWDSSHLVQGTEGQMYDPNPDRYTEVWIGNDLPIDETTEQDLQDSAVLDALFPGLLAQYPDAVAIYYMSPQGLGRYYPVLDLVDTLPPDFPVTTQPFFALASPENNPARRTVWTSPYIDYAGLGPIVTVSTPVYEQDRFRGVISLDLSLTHLIKRLNMLKPTDSGYAFLFDQEHRLIAAPPQAIQTLFARSAFETASFITTTLGIPLTESTAPEFLDVLSAIPVSKKGLRQIRIENQDVFVAYDHLPETGWILGLVAPVDEITAQAQLVATTIEQDARVTVQGTWLVLVILFVAALGGALLLGRWHLVEPIQVLVKGTEAVASGDLTVSIPIRSCNEIGLLSARFNQMIADLRDARQTLEKRVEDRTRELSALYEVTAVASASLDLKPVMEQSLSRILQVMSCDIGSIHLLDETGTVLKLAAWQGTPAEVLPQIQTMPVGYGVAGAVVTHDGPLFVPSIQTESAAVPTAGRSLAGRAYIGAAMRAKGKIVGMLSVIGPVGRTFSAEEIALLAAIADQVGVAVENARLYEQAEVLAMAEERQRIAREIHDTLAQGFVGIKFQLEAVESALEKCEHDLALERLKRAGDVANRSLEEARRSVWALRAGLATSKTLQEVLRDSVRSLTAETELKVTVAVQDDLPAFPAEMQTDLLRIAQEAVMNVVKHAQADRLFVGLQVEDGHVRLTIRDDGRGFRAEEAGAGREDGSGFGLIAMRERVTRHNGTLQVMSTLEEGTSIVAEIALDPKETE